MNYSSLLPLTEFNHLTKFTSFIMCIQQLKMLKHGKKY